MDEEDSQDELINKNASHGKGKRPATSILSDEEENSEDGDDSQDGATDSEEEEEDDVSVDGEGEDGEEEEEEEVDSEHEEAEKDLEGAAGSTSIDLAGLSSDEDAEKCPICLNSFHEQPVATPESCSHYFCLDCILEWAKNANSCPVDRKVFSNILLRKCFGGKVQKTITVQKTAKAGQEEQVDLDLEQTSCEVCGGSDREDRLLLCDGCDAGYHMECLTPPLDAVPVEEWFCPECAANNRNTRRERSSEDENSILPTTSRPQPANSRPTRAIARTQHSERVRANVNRHRITQARTAAQIAPRYLMQSTWLDETINAVVAGLNTAVYVRDLTPRPRSRRRRRTVKRRRGNKEGKAAGGKTASTGVRRRKRRARRTKSRKKLVAKKTATTRGRIARSLGIKNHGRSASIPSVYRPSEQTLGSMRADIGAASLSIYGDPFDLDPFDDENEETQQAPTPSSLLEAKRRGLSRSALRSHQPVARPISAGIPRRGHSIPQVQEVAEAAPVPDLLGSILSGQSMLLMDSSDVVINRDGSLKATKPVSLSLPRSSISGSSMSEESRTPSTEASLFQSSSSSSSSSRPLQRRSSSHSSPLSSPAPLTPVSPSPPTSLTPSSLPGHSRLHTPLPHRSVPSHSAGTEHSQWGTCGFRGQPTSRVPSGASDSRCGERGDAAQQPPAKKPPSKPVWVDVSGLPRIPKIKREGSSAAHGSNRSNNNNFPESSMTSLAGDKGRQHTVDQRAASASQQSRAVDSQRQRLDRTGPSSSFSNSFSAPSSSASVTSNTRPSSSSAISFRINASGNPWHARRLSAPESAMPIKDEKSTKRTQKNKQMLLTSLSQAKKASVKSEVYDPFNPTGSDSSESEAESDCPEMDPQSSVPMQPTVEQNEGPVQQIKTEPMDLDSPVEEASSETCMQIKKEPTSFKEDPWPLPSHNLATGHIQTQSGSLAAVMAYSESPAMSDAESNGTPESPFAKNLGRSRSSSTSSRHSDSKMKIEVKAEPEDQPCPVQPKCKTEPEVPKGNGLCDEVPSAASSFDVSHKSKEQEVISPCPQPEEEGRQGESASQSPPSKDFEHSHKKKKHSRSEEGRHSRSRSPGHRRSRSKSKEKRRSRSRSKDRRRSRSRSKDRRRSRSRSKDKRRSRSRSKDKRRSRSRSKDKRRSRSRSKDKRRSRSRSKDKRRSRSRSKDKRRSRSRSKEKRPSRSRSKERRRSRSRSKERRRSRSRSRERRHSRSRDRMHSTRSSSNESSRKRKPTRDGREQYDSRGRDEHKRSKDKKRSRSRSGSRTRERRREQTSSASRDGGELRSKRKRSRSTSRDPKRRVNVPECSRQKERNKSTASTSIEATAPNHSSNINAIASKEKTDSGGNQCEARVSLVSVKRETEPSSPGCSTLIEESNPEEITKTTPLVAVSNKPHEIKPNQIKQETIWPLEFTEPQLEIKEEKEESNECEELKQPEEIKKEDVTSTSVNEKLEEFSEISSNTSTPRTQTSYSLPQDGKSSNDSFELPKQVKIEHIWPDEEEEEEEEDDDDNPYSDTALVINLCPPAPIDCKTETEDELTSLPVVAKEEMEVEPLQAPCVVKQEPVDSSDEDINVDFLIDNLDFIKKEMKEGSVTDPAGTVEPQPVTQEVSTGSKQEMESALVVAGTKGKSQGKRVTWNIQEPEGPQPEKMSKLALFKLKLKQEGSRRAASTSFTQSCSQDPATVQVGAKPAVTSLNPLAQEGRPNSDQGGSKAHKEELAHDPQHKDKYMKKLHMQERAIEEVKLAIKPFYQKRDITKEEYKEILRKAVQKVCHSKSGEINPVKVANLVKAYVDKYKHARKHRKIGSAGQGHSAEDPKDSETPG